MGICPTIAGLNPGGMLPVFGIGMPCMFGGIPRPCAIIGLNPGGIMFGIIFGGIPGRTFGICMFCGMPGLGTFGLGIPIG